MSVASFCQYLMRDSQNH